MVCVLNRCAACKLLVGDRTFDGLSTLLLQIDVCLYDCAYLHVETAQGDYEKLVCQGWRASSPASKAISLVHLPTLSDLTY